MIHDRLDKIEAKVRETESLPTETKDQLLGIITELKSEVATLGHEGNAAAPVATGSGEKSEIEMAMEEITESVSGFENSHPKLTQLVNRLAVTLSNMGI